jgi:hypothetical protein
MSEPIHKPKEIERSPVSRTSFTENVEIAAWTVYFEDHTQRIHWMLNRKNPLEAGCPCFRAEDLLELPTVLGALAKGFTTVISDLHPIVRAQLERLWRWAYDYNPHLTPEDLKEALQSIDKAKYR